MKLKFKISIALCLKVQIYLKRKIQILRMILLVVSKWFSDLIDLKSITVIKISKSCLGERSDICCIFCYNSGCMILAGIIKHVTLDTLHYWTVRLIQIIFETDLGPMTTHRYHSFYLMSRKESLLNCIGEKQIRSKTCYTSS